MKKYKIALVIGRFQPFHKGHLYLIQQAISLAENVIIGIGSANKNDFDNPFSAEVREEMLHDAIKKEQLQKHIKKIVRLDDYHNDEVWLKKTLEQTGPVDMVIGNNDYVNDIFEAAGYTTVQVPFYKRAIYEGKKIRERMRKLDQLPVSKQPIPTTARKVFSGKLFKIYQWKQRLFDGTTTTFEKVRTKDIVSVIPVTTDGKIMISRQEQPRIEPFTGVFGGWIEKGETPIDAAKRELSEETGYSSDEFILWDATQLFSHIECSIYIFIARNCKKVTEPHLDRGEKIEVKFATFDEFITLVNDEQFRGIEIIVKVLRAQTNQIELNELRQLLS